HAEAIVGGVVCGACFRGCGRRHNGREGAVKSAARKGSACCVGPASACLTASARGEGGGDGGWLRLRGAGGTVSGQSIRATSRPLINGVVRNTRSSRGKVDLEEVVRGRTPDPEMFSIRIQGQNLKVVFPRHRVGGGRDGVTLAVQKVNL